MTTKNLVSPLYAHRLDIIESCYRQERKKERNDLLFKGNVDVVEVTKTFKYDFGFAVLTQSKGNGAWGQTLCKIFFIVLTKYPFLVLLTH